MASINRVIYIGVTNNLAIRTAQHKSEQIKGFSQKYKCKKLIYYEYFTDIKDAIKRETEIKKWRRDKKIKLIELLNPNWLDLSYNFNKNT